MLYDQQRQGVAIPADGRDALIEDLATMVKRLAWVLDQKSPHHPLAEAAKKLLTKNNLLGSPLRKDT